MASAVQWIKITTDIFDDEKMLLIDSMSNSDEIIIIWFKLLCFAGKQNNKGVFMMNNIPYTTKMLSTIFRRNEKTVIKALKIFEEFGMIQYINGAITITNWGRHQNLDKIEANNEYMRNYMREYRKKQKAVAVGKNEDKVNGKLNGKVNINSAEEEKDIESEKSKTEDSISDETLSNLDYESIINSFNSICKSLPKVIKLTEKRKKAITEVNKLLGDITFEQLFEKVANSDFLSGRKGTWCSTFDWIVAPANTLKIIEGNYDDRKQKSKEDYSDCSKYENLTMEV
ncbi:phage replisome organizer N-terminal domain-containing protein [Porcipelethomonas ammoniilytica]|uniref:phage replisome organizer N-terminal domain-containing protein n=1 Tax=Porcipelethomonas ammoniilytica TaxID=2981722 RepID=UPI000A4FCD9F|nr:phage replisome organizer N-terminal domain-containing protein [Porcipelethomonas ammoniilytica]